MGFRTGAYATIWEIKPASDVRTNGRISISRKNKQTGEYETDFSGYVSFLGTAAAQKAAKLGEKDRIRLKDVDATMVYNKEKQITYHNYNIFSFETQEEMDQANNPAQNAPTTNAQADAVFEGAVDEDRLPF